MRGSLSLRQRSRIRNKPPRRLKRRTRQLLKMSHLKAKFVVSPALVPSYENTAVWLTRPAIAVFLL